MPAPTLLPIRLKPTQRCDRCGLRYPRKASECPHCSGLDEQALAQLRERIAEERAGTTNLGWMMGLAAAALLALVLILAVL